MKRLLALLILLPAPVLAGNVSFGGIGSGNVAFGGKGGGNVAFSIVTATSTAPIDVDLVSVGISSANVISSSESVTCTTADSLLVVPFAYRRNNSQVINDVSYAGQHLALGSASNTGVAMRSAFYYLQNPPAGSHNVVVTLSLASPGFTAHAITFKNSTTAPDSANNATSASVATSSTSVTPVSVGDIALSVIVTQDASLASPVLVTSAATQRILHNFGTTGNGGWFGVATSTVTVDPAVINWTSPTSLSTSHVWGAINP